MTDPTPSPNPGFEDFGMDLCPVCGKEVFIIGRTKDGRIIGSCKDAFSTEEWNEGDGLDEHRE